MNFQPERLNESVRAVLSCMEIAAADKQYVLYNTLLTHMRGILDSVPGVNVVQYNDDHFPISDEMIKLAENHGKIALIKEIRGRYGLCLLDAKRIAEKGRDEGMYSFKQW